MIMINRRFLMAGFAASTFITSLSQAKTPALSLLTAPKGSAFLPYGEGLKKVFDAAGTAAITVKETKGSTENIATIETDTTAIGAAFLGSVYQAVQGVAPFADKKHVNLRALFPMYATSFQIAALSGNGITGLSSLNGKKIGVGPAGGPAEGYLKGLATELGLTFEFVNGTADELSKALLAKTIDALWQGASIPIPSFVTLAASAPTTVFGLTEAEVTAMLKRFPFLTRSTTPAGAYAGQTAQILSVSAWNVVIGNKDMPDALAYALTRTVLSASDLKTVVGAAAEATRAENAGVNTVVPYHPGAVRYLKERGITLP
jgi:uncharacterized protein